MMRKKTRRKNRIDRLFTGIILLIFLASMVLPVGVELSKVKRGYSIFLLGGTLLTGMRFLLANVFFLLGTQAIYEGNRKVALVCGMCALIVGIIGAFSLAESIGLFFYPAYWVWLSSFVLLIAVSFRQVILDLSKRHAKRDQ